VSDDLLKLTTYFGERDLGQDGFLADALVDAYARHRVRLSALFRGAEGFGLAHGMHSDRLLTQSEDLPIVSVAVDERERIERVVPEIEHLSRHGLVTLERARRTVEPGDGAGKLTVYLGRKRGYKEVVARLHAHGASGATVLLGVDGTVAGERRRARFVATNAEVPVMVIAIGEGAALAAAAAEIRDALLTFEPVRLAPHQDVGEGRLLKLMVHTRSHDRLMARLRYADVRGATALRGVWGFRGGEQPHGDTFWALRHRVPELVVIVDIPERIARAHEIVAPAGLVTCELVDPV
jgi:PII-like signaling protein